MGVLSWLVVVLVVAPLSAWVAGAVYYDVGGGTVRGRVLAIAWVIAVVALFAFVRPAGYAFAGFGFVVFGFIAWWSSLEARHDRDWRDELAVLPSATVRGDEVTLRNVRHAVYRSLDDVTPRYNDRRVRLSGLRGMDLLISWWGSKFMCHPFAIFEFAPERSGGEPVRVAFSLEVRAKKGQGFSLTRNLYKQNELICVMADERDLMRRRVDHEHDRRLYLYRLRVRPQTMRVRFLEYVDLMNAIAERAVWYHALTTNCTTAIFRRYRSSRPPLDWRVLVNGQMDRYLFDLGLLETGGLEFDELREASFINERVRGLAAIGRDEGGRDDGGFGDAVRAGLPGFSGLAAGSGRG